MFSSARRQEPAIPAKQVHVVGVGLVQLCDSLDGPRWAPSAILGARRKLAAIRSAVLPVHLWQSASAEVNPPLDA